MKIFSDIENSCTQYLASKGISAQVFLLPGGTGLKILKDSNDLPEILNVLPVIELDLSSLVTFNINSLKHCSIIALTLPDKTQLNFDQLLSLNLKKLAVRKCTNHDFSPLSTSGIEILELPESQIMSTEFCADMRLTRLNLANTPIEELSYISDSKLTHLNLLKTKISNLDSLAGMPIQEISLAGTIIDDLEPIARANKLRVVDIRSTRVMDLTPLCDCPIEELLLPGSGVSEIECLIDCPLKKLNLAGIKLDNYQVLENFRLESLTLSPSLMAKYDFDAVKSLDIPFIRGPSDPEEQSAVVFFKKYA